METLNTIKFKGQLFLGICTSPQPTQEPREALGALLSQEGQARGQVCRDAKIQPDINRTIPWKLRAGAGCSGLGSPLAKDRLGPAHSLQDQSLLCVPWQELSSLS